MAQPSAVRQASHQAPAAGTRTDANRPGDAKGQKTSPPQSPRQAVTASEVKTRLTASDATENRAGRPAAGRGAPLITMLGSLAVVIGLFLLVAWGLRRNLPKGSQGLSREVVDVLGQATLAHRQQVQLVRLGNKLLLVNVSASGAETLAEVNDPAEVERLTALCRKPGEAVEAPRFRDLVQQFRQRTTTNNSGANMPPPVSLLASRARQEESRG